VHAQKLIGVCDLERNFRVALTIKTSNSSRHLKGDSMMPHKAVRKEMVDTDLSPPDKDFITDVLSSTPFSEYSSFGPLWTFTCGGPERTMKVINLRYKTQTKFPWNTRPCYEQLVRSPLKLKIKHYLI